MPPKKPSTNLKKSESAKITTLAEHTEQSQNSLLTTNHGVKVSDDQNTLKAGNRGLSLPEDFIMREKITHFDHERIVHARGSGAHAVFELYNPIPQFTKAGFLNDTSVESPSRQIAQQLPFLK